MAVHSFHLFSDEAPDRPTVELMIERPPSVDLGYFWAMQVDWDDGSGAHIGLQWWPGYPGNGAVNWGGYRAGVELEGTVSPLPSSTGNVNTRDFPWEAGRWYRLEVAADGTGWVDGQEIRRLAVASRRIVRVAVWTEMFAPCSAPSTKVRWRGLPSRVTCNYEPTCGNTVSYREGNEVVQETGLSRWPWSRPIKRQAFV